MTDQQAGASAPGTFDEPLLELAPCGFATVAYEGPILQINETLLSWTGYTREEIVGVKSFADLVTRAARAYGQTHLRPMLLTAGSIREIALTMVCADGSRLPILLNARLDRDADGQPSVISIAVFDASERRQYEEELLRAKQEAEASEERSRQLARTLQSTLIPSRPPAVPGLEIAAGYRPSGDGEEVGGDFYDVFQIGPGDWVVVLGDVCGKGVDAAVITALVRYSVRAATVDHRSPAQALGVVNRILLEHGTDRFCTLVLLRLWARDGGWDVVSCSAGHPLPIVVRAGDAPEPTGTLGTLLGVLDDPPLTDDALRLGFGDRLMLYTDGILEARREGELFGELRLLDALDRHGRGDVTVAVDALLAATMAFQGERADDDIALVVLGPPAD